MKFGLTICTLTLILAPVARGGLFDGKPVCGEVCRTPEISRPCRLQVTGHQRQDLSCQPICGPVACAEAVSCCAPAGPACCAPVSPTCYAPAGCDQGELCVADQSARCRVDGCSSESGCQQSGCCCADERCEVADLIRQSMTACYARQRRNAVHQLSDYYDLRCHPQIMDALVYALNDSDERVRAKAADEIGDQIRRNGCCLNDDVICVLRYSLADCDRRVRRQAEEALQLCGYQIVNGHCCCPVTTGEVLTPTPAPTALPVPANDGQESPMPMPIPAPPESSVDHVEEVSEADAGLPFEFAAAVEGA